MQTARESVTTSKEFLGTVRQITLDHTTDYTRYSGEFTHTAHNAVKVTATDRSHGWGTVMLSMTASGSMHGDPVDDESMGLGFTVSHLTPDEARIIARALLAAADEMDGMEVAA